MDSYDIVDEHLTLVIEKNKMSYSNNENITNPLHECARDNALRMFISELRLHLSDLQIYQVLATAQELKSDKKCQGFEGIFCSWRCGETSDSLQKRSINLRPTQPSYKYARPTDQRDAIKAIYCDPDATHVIPPPRKIFNKAKQ